jgi:hypothetical protein
MKDDRLEQGRGSHARRLPEETLRKRYGLDSRIEPDGRLGAPWLGAKAIGCLSRARHCPPSEPAPKRPRVLERRGGDLKVSRVAANVAKFHILDTLAAMVSGGGTAIRFAAAHRGKTQQPSSARRCSAAQFSPLEAEEVKKVAVWIGASGPGITNNRELPDICMQHLLEALGTSAHRGFGDIMFT